MNNDKEQKPTNPINKESEVQESNDPQIDRDMPGFPHHPSKEEDLKEKDPIEKAHEK